MQRLENRGFGVDGYIVVFVAIVACAALVQIILGSDLPVLALELITIAISLYVLHHLGTSDMGAVVLFIFVTNTVTISLFIKTILLQPVESYLYTPVWSFAYVLLGTTIYAVAVYASAAKKVKPILQTETNYERLSYMGKVGFFLGALAWMLSIIFAPGYLVDARGDSDGLGGILFFKEFMVFGIIATTAGVIRAEKKSKRAVLVLAAMLLITFVFGVIDNQKRQILVMMVGVLVTIFYFGRLKFRHLIVVALIFLGMNSFIFPIMHSIRYEYLMANGINEKLLLLTDVIFSGNFLSLILDSRSDVFDILSNPYYYDYFNRPELQVIFGRAAAIQMIDPIIYSTDLNNNLLGFDYLLHELQSIIPHVIYPDKNMQAGGAYVTTSLGLMSPDEGAYPTVPMLAGLYAAFGFAGFPMAFVIFMAFLLIMRFIGWQLSGNIYACFFLVINFNYIAEGSLGQYLAFILRGAPTLILVLLAIRFSCDRAVKQGKSTSILNIS